MCIILCYGACDKPNTISLCCFMKYRVPFVLCASFIAVKTYKCMSFIKLPAISAVPLWCDFVGLLVGAAAWCVLGQIL